MPAEPPSFTPRPNKSEITISLWGWLRRSAFSCSSLKLAGGEGADAMPPAEFSSGGALAIDEGIVLPPP